MRSRQRGQQPARADMIYDGVDYAGLRPAEQEADVVAPDGGNKDGD